MVCVLGGWHLKFWMGAQGVTEMVFEPRPEKMRNQLVGCLSGKEAGNLDYAWIPLLLPVGHTGLSAIGTHSQRRANGPWERCGPRDATGEPHVTGRHSVLGTWA